MELCLEYNQNDPVEFVEQWMAYSISNLNGAEPTVQYLLDMENKELRNQSHVPAKSNPQSKNISNLKVYNQDSDDDETAILGSYVCLTPKVSK